MRTVLCFPEQGAPEPTEAVVCSPARVEMDGSSPNSCPVPERTVVVAETPISNLGRKMCSLRAKVHAGNASLVGALILLCQTALTAQSCQAKCGELFCRERRVPLSGADVASECS